MKLKRLIKRMAAGFLAATMTVSMAVPVMAEGESDSESVSVLVATARKDGDGNSDGFAARIIKEAGGADNVKAIRTISAADITEKSGKTLEELTTDSTKLAASKLTDGETTISSTKQTYAWYDGDGTVYIFSEADKVYANPSSKLLFFDALSNTQLSNLSAIDISGIDWRYAEADGLFNYLPSLNEIDLSKTNINEAKSTTDIFSESGIKKFTMPDAWAFSGVTLSTGIKGNWTYDGESYSAYAIESGNLGDGKTKQFGGGEYTRDDSKTPVDKNENIYQASMPNVNNVWSIYDTTNRFTGFCIDGYPKEASKDDIKKISGTGDIYGYYEKETWNNETAEVEVTGGTTSSYDGYVFGGTMEGYFNTNSKRVTGKSPLGSNMKETLIALLYYGPQKEFYGGDNGVIDTQEEYDAFQACIWHYTNRYDGTMYDADKWQGKTFDTIPGHDFYDLDVYKSLRGVQHMITLRSIPVETTVTFKKVAEDGVTSLSGADIVIYGGTDAYNKDTSVIAATITDATQEVKLPVGIYTIHEISAPAGYELAADIVLTVDENANIVTSDSRFDANTKTFTMKDDRTPEETKEFEVEISKVDITSSKEIEGADLKITDKDNNEIASWTSGDDGKDDNGSIKTHKIKLEPGTYTLEETIAPKGYSEAESIVFTVGTDGKITVSGDDENGRNGVVVMKDKKTVNIKKVDEKGKYVDGAYLQITEKNNDDPATNKLGPWKTISNKITELSKMNAGSYILEEVADDDHPLPAGYMKADPIEFDVDENGNVTNCDSAAGNTITMVDKRIIVKISKTDVAGDELEGAGLKIYEGDVTGLDNDEKKDFVADDLGRDGKKDAYWVSGDDGKTDGKVNVHEVWLAAGTYTLEETAEPEGYEKAESIVFTVDASGNVTVKGDDENGKDGTVVMIDKKESTEKTVTISKTDINGDEIEGADLKITDENGKEVASWRSGDDGKNDDGKVKTHTVKLEPGTYVLHEEGAPDGYITASDITFAVDKDGTVTVKDDKENGKDSTVTMIDKWTETDVVFSKTDVGGTEIEGADLKITDKDGKEIASWTSGDDGKDEDGKIKTHTVKLEPGTYTMTETTAPSGYKKAESITFTVEVGGKVTIKDEDQSGKITMKDEPIIVEISKIDATGKEELPGATLTITKGSTGKGAKVEEWTSGDDGKDENGKIKTHTVQLPKGTYTLTETTAPDGYRKAESIVFVVDEDGKVKVSGTEVSKVVMEDKPTTVIVSKVKAEDTDKYLSGAKLQILDENKKVVEEWTTEGKAHTITGTLVADKTYTLHEVSAPSGYKKADDIKFTCTGKDQKIVMEDAAVTTTTGKLTIKKVDSTKTTTYVSGAKLQLLNSSGKVVEEWTTKSESHTISASLTVGSTYVLHEVSAPDGYSIASDISIKITSKNQTVTMKDAPGSDYKIIIRKVDDNSEPVSGAKMQILDSDGDVVEEWTTDGTSHTVKADLETGEKYTIHEKSAPDGYSIAEDKTFTYSKDQTIKIVDKKKKTTTKTTTTTTTNTTNNTVTETPKTETKTVTKKTTSKPTGDAANMALWLGLGGAAVIGLAGFAAAKKHKKK